SRNQELNELNKLNTLHGKQTTLGKFARPAQILRYSSTEQRSRNRNRNLPQQNAKSTKILPRETESERWGQKNLRGPRRCDTDADAGGFHETERDSGTVPDHGGVRSRTFANSG